MRNKTDERYQEALKEHYSKDIDSIRLKEGMKENKRLYNRFIDRIGEIERNLGASINFNRDYQDENYKYNYLRMRLWKKKNSTNVLNVEK